MKGRPPRSETLPFSGTGWHRCDAIEKGDSTRAEDSGVDAPDGWGCSHCSGAARHSSYHDAGPPGPLGFRPRRASPAWEYRATATATAAQATFIVHPEPAAAAAAAGFLGMNVGNTLSGL